MSDRPIVNARNTQRPMFVIDISVRISDRPVPLRACLAEMGDRLGDAIKPIHTNSEPLFDTLQGQYGMEQTVIRTARKQVADLLARDISDYLVNVVFAENDTHNGYTKEPSNG